MILRYVYMGNKDDVGVSPRDGFIVLRVFKKLGFSNKMFKIKQIVIKK
jgi:hypothetical protein